MANAAAAWPQRRWGQLLAVLLLALGAAGCGRRPAAGGGVPQAALPVRAERIVSLAPSITEILYELELGPRVVGVTSFCDYPPDAGTKPKVGGLVDPNIEAIVALRPDLVVLFASHDDAITALRALAMPCLTVKGDTMEQVLGSIETIATACGCPERGQELVQALRRRIEAVAKAPRPAPPPRLLVSVGRTMGAGQLQDIYVAAEDGFFSELIRLAGACNACPEKTIRFPLVSPEGILEMAPDIIVELAADLQDLGLKPETVVREWDVVGQVPAVRNGQVYVFTEDYVTVPGPRFVLLLEKLAAVVRQARPLPPAARGAGP